METQVTKWGNSLAVRLPKAFASEMGLSDGTSVDLTIEDHRIIVEPRKRYTLAELAGRISPENRHEGFGDGPSEGRELW